MHKNSPEPDPNLESLLHQELRKLPMTPPPPSLMPRVMQAIRARSHQPWWRQSLWAWPWPAQGLVLLLAVSLVGIFASCQGLLGNGLRYLFVPVVDACAKYLAISQAQQWWAGWTTWLNTTLGPNWLLYAAGIVCFAYVCCLAVGTLLVRMVQKSAHTLNSVEA